MKLIFKVSLLVVFLAAGSAQAQNLKDAWLDIKKKDFKKQFVHLAMMPVVAAPVVGLPEAMRQLISAEVLKKFTKSRYKILVPQEVKLIQDQFASLYPTTASAESIAAIGDHTVRELFFRHPVNGIISVQVLAVAAPFANDKAQWDGTTQKIKHRGDGLFGAILGKDYGGHIAASSIRVVISDRSGKPIYNWSGGVEVLMQRDGQKLEALPTAELWQNQKKVLKAVKYALKPI